MVDSNLLLAGHALIILSGIFIAFSNKFFSSQRDRLLAGLSLVLLGGFTVSTHTWWFHNKYHELGGDIGCSAFSSFSCGDVLANSDWNTVPILGIPWGLMGMFAFALLGFLALSIRKEHNAKWVKTYLDIGYVASGFGILIALYLLYVEIVPLEMTFCQYCSVAHLADIIAFVMFMKLRKLQGTDQWDPVASQAALVVKTKDIKRSQRKKNSGFVKPITRDEEE